MQIGNSPYPLSGTVHDGVLAQSGLRDSALHELYGYMYAARPTCKFCMPSASMMLTYPVLDNFSLCLQRCHTATNRERDFCVLPYSSLGRYPTRVQKFH